MQYQYSCLLSSGTASFLRYQNETQFWNPAAVAVVVAALPAAVNAAEQFWARNKYHVQLIPAQAV